jgi:hypothetical protein
MLPLFVQRSNLLPLVPPLLSLHGHHRARGAVEVIELLAAVEEHLVVGRYDECRVGRVVDQVMFQPESGFEVLRESSAMEFLSMDNV